MSIKSSLTELAEVIREKTGKTVFLSIEEIIHDVKKIAERKVNPEDLLTILMSGTGNGSVLVENTITNLRTGAFYKITGLEYAEFKKVDTAESNAFCECRDLKILKLPVCKKTDINFCKNCIELEYASIPQCLEISNFAFYNCEKLLKVEAESSTRIGNAGFQGCRSLTEINLPVCSSLQDNAFKGCSSLRQMILPAMRYISNGCFEESGLEYLDVLGQTGGHFMGAAFKNSNLSSLVIRNASAVLFIPNMSVFEGTPISQGKGFIYVHSAVIDAYRTHSVWKNFADNIVAIEGTEFEITEEG